MEYTIPEYYGQFSCIADACEDTCCAGWAIVIDDRSMKKYMKMKGGFGNRLRNSINVKEGTFEQYGQKRCAFLNDQNLCDIYAEAGKEMLCRTCRRYPRHIEEYENLREISLSLSCPEAARIILGKKEPVRFVTVEKEGEEEYGDFDYFLFSALMDTRQALFEILQNRKFPVSFRLSMALALCHDIQRKISSEALFSVPDVLYRYSVPGTAERFAAVLRKKSERFISGYDAVRGMFSQLYELEHLRAEWPELLKESESILYGSGKYTEICRHTIDETILEQIAVYFVYTYFAGAVYDGKPYSKMKLAAVSVILIRELLLAEYEKKGCLEFADYVEMAHRYAREIEHSDENLKTLEQMFSKNPAFLLENILAGLKE